MDLAGQPGAAHDPRRPPARRPAKTVQLDPLLADVDLTTRALLGGVAYADLPRTTLREIELRYRAKEHEAYLYTKALVDLEVSKMSARQLGEAHEKDLEKDETALTDEARWEEIGAEIKEKIHASMVYAFMPEHLRAVYRVQFGAPGQEEEDTAVPLRGVRPETAQTVMRVKESGAWKEKPWAQSEFWRQWREEGAKARLRATARLARDEEF